MGNYRFCQEDFTAIGESVLIKVIIKPEYGLVRNRLNKDSNYAFGFVSEKTNFQHLILKPRSWDDRITHIVCDDGDALEFHDNSEFHLWFGEIEWVYVEYRKGNQLVSPIIPQHKHKIL